MRPSTSTSTKLQINCIKTKDKVYIQCNTNILSDYLFDGNKANPTYHRSWFELSKIPEKVDFIYPITSINHRYELVDGVICSLERPPILHYEDFYDEEGDLLDKYNIKLYEKTSDVRPSYTEEVEFDINIIEELDEFTIVKTEFPIKSELIDMIRTPDVLLPTKPCSLSSVESYAIIRKFVKENINPKVASITSDYDFCFTVKKNIDVNTPIPYEYNVNAWTNKKAKYETRYRNTRDMVVFETAPDKGGRDGVYKGYTRTEEFRGENYEDMCNNINKFLNEVIEEINKPLKDCPHCSGRGVILK